MDLIQGDVKFTIQKSDKETERISYAHKVWTHVKPKGDYVSFMMQQWLHQEIHFSGRCYYSSL